MRKSSVFRSVKMRLLEKTALRAAEALVVADIKSPT